MTTFRNLVLISSLGKKWGEGWGVINPITWVPFSECLRLTHSKGPNWLRLLPLNPSPLFFTWRRNQNQISKRSHFNLLAFVFIRRWKEPINSIIQGSVCYYQPCRRSAGKGFIPLAYLLHYSERDLENNNVAKCVQRNNEAPSRNHCCRGEEKKYYILCVCLQA